MQTINNHLSLLIGKDIARTASVQALDPTAAAFLADGEIVVCDASGTVLDSTTVIGKEKIFIRQGQGTSKPQIISPAIFKKGVKSFKVGNYTAKAEQISYVGFDATTSVGSIDVINSNDYIVRITDKNSTTYGTKGIDKIGAYTSDSTATQLEVATGLAKSLRENFERVTPKPLIVERVSNGTFGTTVSNVTLTNGSTTVTKTAHGISAGAIVRFYATTDNVLGAVYVVASVTANTFELDIPYQGASSTTLECFVNTVAPTAYGIRLTGQANPFSVESREYVVNRFDVAIVNGGTTTITTPTKAFEGHGVYEQVAALEYFAQGFEGFIDRNTVPHVSARANADSAEKYSFLVLEHTSKQGTAVTGNAEDHKQTILAFAITAAGAPNTYATNAQGAASSVAEVLNAWLVDTDFADVTLA